MCISFAAYEEAREDVLLVAQRILMWYEGRPRPTVEEPEFMDALDRLRDRLDAAPSVFDRRAVNTDLRQMSKETP
jgi:predicted RND superfamily exporter protein